MIVRNAGRLVFSYLVDRGLDRHTGWDMLFQVLMLSITKAYLISSLNIRLVFFDTRNEVASSVRIQLQYPI